MTDRVAARRATFRDLHASGCFVLPNAWDAGSARFLASLGFAALASTSSGSAWAHGRPDGGQDRDAVLEQLRELVAATDLPVNADFENGYGATPEEVGANVALAASTGVAGLSIEDATGDDGDPLFPLAEAVERLRAAREADPDLLLVGRAEGFLWGRPDLDDVVARLQAYAEAGADCLYAPGVSESEQIATLVRAVAPHPVNVLVGGSSALTVADLAALGVRRVSVGGALARAAWGGLRDAATALVDGRFDGFGAAMAGSELDDLFRD
jgi:2-methylisocitrate lyase-like PEP mutase family enzyme